MPPTHSEILLALSIIQTKPNETNKIKKNRELRSFDSPKRKKRLNKQQQKAADLMNYRSKSELKYN